VRSAGATKPRRPRAPASEPGERTLWRVAGRGALAWRVLGGDIVVYHGASGDMHVVSPVAAEVLRGLERAPAEAAAIARHLASVFPEEDEAGLSLYARGALRQLRHLGLVERYYQ